MQNKTTSGSAWKQWFSASTVATLRFKPLLLWSALKQFVRNYRLPVIITLLLTLPIIYLALARFSESKSLLKLLPSISDNGQDYGNLLVADTSKQFNRGSTTEDQKNTNLPAGTTGSFAFNATSNNSGSGGGSGGTSGGSSGGNSTPVFGAAISYFNLDSTTLDCSNPLNPNTGTCSKVYHFSAGVQTANGPGTVNYSWVSNQQDVNADGSFAAPSGSATQALKKDVILSCTKQTSFSLQLVLSSPVVTHSETKNFNHNCVELKL